MLVKCILVVMGVEAKGSCGTEQLCGGVEAGIEGGIHVVQLLWKQYSQEGDWVFLIIDVCNSFN